MHKWQEKQRQRIHDSKIENAKSNYQKLSRSREKPLCSSRTKLTNHYKTPIPFLRILEIFQLNHYANILQFYGFPQRLTNRDCIADIQEMLAKVLPKDKDNFYSMISTLFAMSKKVIKEQTKIKDPKRNSILSRSQKTHLPPSSSKASSTGNKVEKTIDNKKDKIHDNFRIRTKVNPSHYSVDRKTTKDPKQNHKLIKRKKTQTPTHDDLCITHNYKHNHQGQPTLIHHSNTLIRKLYQKINPRSLILTSQNTLDINLDLDKIKQMYLSYDSATLTSNIINIDIEQIIECMALEILALLMQYKDKGPTINQKYLVIQQLLKDSFLAVQQQSKDSQTQNQETKIVLKKSPQIPSTDLFASANQEDTQSINNESASDNSSEDWQYDVDFYSSLVRDFSCFDNRFENSILIQPPTKKDIKNFIQLVMMAGKMEKQIPIIANVYIHRLLKKATNSKITNVNWRNIVLICLIQGSKIWDDQSLENHSFAKFIKPYTTLEINRLQKYLLAYLDYQLTVKQKQYSESYFLLRNYAGKASKTCNLLKLDLKTIKKLQSGSKKAQIKMKDFYQKCMNKSF